MPALTITVPAAGDLPTTVAKLLSALDGIVVAIDEGHGNPYDGQVIRAVEADGHVALQVHPFRDLGQGYEEADQSRTLVVPLELIEGIEVH